jgi:hypothetical protein
MSNLGKRKAPEKLKLEFSKASDYERVSEFFDPSLKDEIDVANYISNRGDTLRNAITDGCASFLSDEQDRATVLVVDYQTRLKNLKNMFNFFSNQHDYTELATVMSRVSMRGYQSATLVVSATALKEWWVHPPKKALMTSIERTNKPPQNIANALTWELVPKSDKLDEMFKAVYSTAEEPEPQGEARDEVLFFECGDKAIQKQAQTVLAFMKAGGVVNHKTKDVIPVDFSAFEEIGLTKPRLEAIASGNLSRPVLKSL